MSKTTIIEALRDSLVASARYNPDDVVRPAAILWTDADHQWTPIIDQLQNQLRNGSRVAVLQGRVVFGGSLSGRDLTAVNKTVSGLIKLLYPDPDMPVPDEDLEGIVRLALESRRRVKEQQKKCLKAEFRNTHFSYTIGENGVEQFVATPELHSEDQIDADPLPPGQVWAVSPGSTDAGPSLYRVEVTVGPGSGVKILNHPVPPAFRESVRYAEQNLYTRAKELIGDRDPRGHEFSIQLRAMDNDKTGAGISLPVMVALSSGLLERSLKGGLMPVSARKQLFDLSDDMATKINIRFYSDAQDALIKAMVE